MMLFVFEGAEREPRIFRTLEHLYFGKGECVVRCFGNNIYELYRQLKEFDGSGDLVSILRERELGKHDSPFPEGVKSSDFSQIYLFFDYDFQNGNLSLDEMNNRLTEMLSMFNDETDNGKLYVSYPMIESLYYTKTLPDEHFSEYTVSRKACMASAFKGIAASFSSYGSFNFLELPDEGHKVASKNEVEKIMINWQHIVNQHVSKANYICTGHANTPTDKLIVSQDRIFAAQLTKYLNNDVVSILNAFPLFLYEYFKVLD